MWESSRPIQLFPPCWQWRVRVFTLVTRASKNWRPRQNAPLGIMLKFDARVKNFDAAQPRVTNVKTPIESVLQCNLACTSTGGPLGFMWLKTLHTPRNLLGTSMEWCPITGINNPTPFFWHTFGESLCHTQRNKQTIFKINYFDFKTLFCACANHCHILHSLKTQKHTQFNLI